MTLFKSYKQLQEERIKQAIGRAGPNSEDFYRQLRAIVTVNTLVPSKSLKCSHKHNRI